MKKLVILILIFTAINLFSNEYAEPIYDYGKYKIGAIVPLFGDNVNIRKSASLKSPVLDRLPISSQVKILAQTGSSMTLSGYKENWYHIQYMAKGQTGKGYIWGGLLAKAWIEKDLNGNGKKDWMLMGIAKKDGMFKTAEARMVRDGKLLSSVTFRPIETSADSHDFSYAVAARHEKPDRFKPVPDLFYIKFEYGACDYENGEIVLFWNGKKLGYGFEASGMSGEAGSIEYKILYPGAEDIEKNQIKVLQTITNREEGSTDTSWTLYQWTGEEFKVIRELSTH
jgi:hypothetical protein